MNTFPHDSSTSFIALAYQGARTTSLKYTRASSCLTLMGQAQGYNTRVCWLEAWGITAPIAESPAGPGCPQGCTA